jgi:hypothetical protein
MIIFLPAAASLGAKERARLDYVTDAFGDASGVGTVAVIMAIALAIGGAASGVLTDRVRPQRVLATALAVTAIVNLVTGLSLLDGPLTIPYVIGVTAVEWLSAGVAIPALLKVQAALVPLDARGSAEIVNALRLGVGAMVGILLASVSPSTAATMLGCAVAVAGVMVGVLIVARGVARPTGTHVAAPRDNLWTVLMDHPVLRRVVVADLVLTFAIPTQLSNVVIVEEADASLVLPVLLTGVLGVLIGRVALLYTGALGDVRRALLTSFGLYVALVIVSVPLVVTGVALDREEVASGAILVGSALSAYALGLLSALVQQLVPDAVRGALSGFMAAGRSLLVAGAAVVITAVVVPLSTGAVVVTVGALGIAALAAVRGFAGIRAR